MQHQTFRLDRPRNPLVQLVPAEHPHAPPRRTLTSVMHGKFLNWLAQASVSDIRKALVRLTGVILLAGLVGSVQFTLGFLLAIAKWNGSRIPLFLALLGLTLNARRIVRLATRHRTRSKAANQHTYKGLPVDELATYLVERRSFTRDDACAKFGVSWKKHDAIAKELEHHQVLVRGDNNARVLNAITREQLVRQLREKFPLEFHGGEWCERNGSWERHLRDSERAEQKERERVERLEKRAGRATAILREVAELKRAEGFAYSPALAA